MILLIVDDRFQNFSNNSVYVNTLVVAVVCVFGFGLSSILINAVGKKVILSTTEESS